MANLTHHQASGGFSKQSVPGPNSPHNDRDHLASIVSSLHVENYSAEWLYTADALRHYAHQCGYSTVELVVSALESELASGMQVETIRCHLDALATALDLDEQLSNIHDSERISRYQQALLASLAIRMHG